MIEKERNKSEFGNHDLRFQSERFASNPRWNEIEKLIDNRDYFLSKYNSENKIAEALEIYRKYTAELDYFDIIDGLILPFEDVYSMFVWFSELDRDFRIETFKVFENIDDEVNTETENILNSLDETKAKYLGYLLKTYYKNELDEKYNEFINEENYEALAVIKKYSLDLTSIPVKE